MGGSRRVQNAPTRCGSNLGADLEIVGNKDKQSVLAYLDLSLSKVILARFGNWFLPYASTKVIQPKCLSRPMDKAMVFVKT